ncbi:hypothetical protein [Leifsonia xyli]|uniref:hypothetical protein n=1 Tax=Leifsonia xyli TaxID=1575 RepID=UPI003D66DE8A
MRITGKRRTGTVTLVIAALLFAGATPAQAAEEPQPDEIALFARGANGEVVKLDADFVAKTSFDLHTAPSDGQVTLQLINWDQWFGCFSLNNETDVFATYAFPWNGSVQLVRLKCGTDSYGYKHIRAKHESQWQAQLDGARAHGWNSQAFGVESWDDLMSAVTGAIITYPDYYQAYPLNNKRCSNTEFYLQNLSTGAIVYSFRAIASWASDSDRLITSYPTTSLVC